MQGLNLKHNWFGVYHRSYLDISFDFQVLNVILNKIWPHGPPLCDIERLYLPPDAIQAYCCSSELHTFGHSLRLESVMASQGRRLRPPSSSPLLMYDTWRLFLSICVYFGFSFVKNT